MNYRNDSSKYSLNIHLHKDHFIMCDNNWKENKAKINIDKAAGMHGHRKDPAAIWIK